MVALYVVATCGPLLWSSHRNLALFGAVNLGVVGLLVWSVQSGFVSLWCFWAAITSIAIVDDDWNPVDDAADLFERGRKLVKG